MPTATTKIKKINWLVVLTYPKNNSNLNESSQWGGNNK
jgi:hypothetical protein